MKVTPIPFVRIIKGALIRCTNVCENYSVIFKLGYLKMAIYHCSVSVGSRSNGSSAVASDAYREGKKITNERTGEIHDYSRKKDVIESETLAPKNAPDFCRDSSQLWNKVEATEKRKDAQLFREVTVALPREFTHEQNKELVRDYSQRNFIDNGMVATVSYHSSKTENPHAHIMLTMREIKGDGFGQKVREWNAKPVLNEWRKDWADSVNRTLQRNDIEQRVDHRTLKDQGIERTPQIHVGYAALEMEKRGEVSERGEQNREIIRSNEPVQEVSNGIDLARLMFEQHLKQQKNMEHQKHERARQIEIQRKQELKEQAISMKKEPTKSMGFER